MDHPRPWLRYVNAADLEHAPFEDTKVESATGDQLGEVDGFIVDADTGRPQYLVVDAGGWFKSKHFLVPIGHTRFDVARGAMAVDLSRDRVERYPGFDKYEFERLSDDQLDRIAIDTAAACCPTDRQTHYHTPDWWKSDYYRPTRQSVREMAGGMREPSMVHDKNRD